MAADTLFCPGFWRATEAVSSPSFRVPDFGVRPGETFLLLGSEGVLALIRRLPVQPSVVLAGKEPLNAALLNRVRPDRVVMPLIGPRRDAIDTLKVLARHRFRGAACVLAGPLPRPEVVLAELQARASGMEVHLLVLTHWPSTGT